MRFFSLIFLFAFLIPPALSANLTREDTLRLNAAEMMVEEGRRMIEEGRRMASIRDGRSRIDGSYIDRSSTRTNGQLRIKEGQEKVRRGMEIKKALLENTKAQSEDAEITLSGDGQPLNEAHSSSGKIHYRTWTDRQGRQIQAAFKGVFDGEVQLLRQDGERVIIPLETLSDRDAQYARLVGLGLSFDQDGLLKAVRHHNEDAMKLYSQAGITLSRELLADELIRAVECDDVTSIRFLLKHGAGVEAPSASGELPLHTAVRSGLTDTVNLLLEQGAPVERREPASGLTALECALTQRNRDITKTLHRQTESPSPRIVWAVREYQDGRVESIGVDFVKDMVRLDRETPFDPEDSMLSARLHMLLVGYDLSAESFYAALAQNDMSLLEIYVQAGALDVLDFSQDSSVWFVVWSVCPEQHRDYLLEAAGIDVKGQLLLQARCMDLYRLVDHATRLQEVVRPTDAGVVARSPTVSYGEQPALRDLTLQEVAALPDYVTPYDPEVHWAGGTPAQRNTFDYMREKYPELGSPDLSGYRPVERNIPPHQLDYEFLRQILQAQQPQRADQDAAIDRNPQPLPGMPGSKCSSCGGDGVCFSCDGAGGRKMYGQSSPYGKFVRCSNCNGTGRCQSCRGTGKL